MASTLTCPSTLPVYLATKASNLASNFECWTRTLGEKLICDKICPVTKFVPRQNYFRVPIGKFYTWLKFLHNQRLCWSWQISSVPLDWVSFSLLPLYSTVKAHMSLFVSSLFGTFLHAIKFSSYFDFDRKKEKLKIWTFCWLRHSVACSQTRGRWKENSTLESNH